jgi:NAD(P)-dependent dehydrogenase (short-subunit alcohol dehydrogenase family)
MTDGEDRTLIITGATGGVGQTVARRLLDRGDRLLLVARGEDRLASVREALGSDRCTTFVADVTEPAQADAAVAEGFERFGSVDGLVHLVGTFAARPVFIAEPDLYLDLFKSNVLSAAVMTRALLPRLKGPAYLVFLSSLLGSQPMFAMAPYAAAKAGLTAWAQALAREVKDMEIHANVIVGGLFDTELTRALEYEADRSATEVTPEQVSEVIAFLTSPGASAIHGGTIACWGRLALDPPQAVLARAAAQAAAGGPPPGATGGPPPGVPGGPPPGVAGGEEAPG